MWEMRLKSADSLGSKESKQGGGRSEATPPCGILPGWRGAGFVGSELAASVQTLGLPFSVIMPPGKLINLSELQIFQPQLTMIIPTSYGP